MAFYEVNILIPLEEGNVMRVGSLTINLETISTISTMCRLSQSCSFEVTGNMYRLLYSLILNYSLIPVLQVKS